MSLGDRRACRRSARRYFKSADRTDARQASRGRDTERAWLNATLNECCGQKIAWLSCQAKARLDEAEATLRRVRRLIELGAGAGKDLIAAETATRQPKQNTTFKATSRSTVKCRKRAPQSRLRVLTFLTFVTKCERSARRCPKARRHDHNKDTSLVALRAPVSGTVIERLVNAGAGVKPGKPLFTIANISTVWIIANVPEAQVGSVQCRYASRSYAAAAFGNDAISGRVAYIDPQLNEETRTARVRIEMSNPGERLKAGMFVEVGFQAGTCDRQARNSSLNPKRCSASEIARLSSFRRTTSRELSKCAKWKLEAKSADITRVSRGLQLGEKVVTKGSFTLKTQMMKGEMGDHDH